LSCYNVHIYYKFDGDPSVWPNGYFTAHRKKLYNVATANYTYTARELIQTYYPF